MHKQAGATNRWLSPICPHGDNLLTKVEPFMDDFNDGGYTGWTVGNGTWSATNNDLRDTVSNAANDYIWFYGQDDDNNEMRFRYRRTASSGVVTAWVRHAGANDLVRVEFDATVANLKQTDGGVATTLDTDSSVTSAMNTWYNVRIVCDGATVKVYRWTDGNLETEVLSTSSATQLTSDQVALFTGFWTKADFDDVWLIGTSASNTTTFAVNNANELSTMTDPNGTTSFGFDGWGRMTSKSRGSYSASYGYKYGQMLCSVTSNWPGEGNVTYNYGGNFQRRERTVSGVTTNFNWNFRYGIISEETTSGLTRSHVGQLADISGTDPSSGQARYYHSDTLESVACSTDSTSNVTNDLEFTPYGSIYLGSGPQTSFSYAGLVYQPESDLAYGTFRYYSVSTSRWMTRDPLGLGVGTNIYLYCLGNPILYNDPFGLCVSWGDFLDGIQTGLDVIGMVPGLGEPFDLISGGISLARGDLVGAGLSLAGAVPILGNATGAAKIGRQAFGWLDEGTSGIYKVYGPSKRGGPIIQRGNKQIHYHNDPPYHDVGSPHIDKQGLPGGRNSGRLPC